MLSILVAAALSCVGLPELGPPERGATFAYAMPGGLYMHSEIVSANRNGHVTTRTVPAPAPTSPGPSMMRTAPSSTSFMGMILVESSSGRSFRRRSIPRDLLSQVRALGEGETLAFNMTHEARIGGEGHRFTETHSITFMGCGSVETGQGVMRTRSFNVDTVGIALVRGEPQITRTQKQYDISVDHGWFAYTADRHGELRLSRASIGR